MSFTGEFTEVGALASALLEPVPFDCDVSVATGGGESGDTSPLYAHSMPGWIPCTGPSGPTDAAEGGGAGVVDGVLLSIGTFAGEILPVEALDGTIKVVL